MIRMGALQGYQELMQKFRVDPLPLLKKYKIDFNHLHDIDGFIEIISLVRLLEESALVTGCTDFGLQLTKLQQHDMLGLYLVLLKNTSSIEQAVEDASRYLFLHSPAMKLVLEEQQVHFKNSVTLYFDINLPEFVSQRQMIDGSLGRIFLIVTQQFNISYRYIKAVSLPHTPLTSKSAYQRFFKVPVYFEQPYAAIHFDRDLLQFELTATNPHIRQAIIQDIGVRFPHLNLLSMSDRVEYLLRVAIGLSPMGKTEIAALLCVHPRTLQRRLHIEHTHFEEIKEKVYRQVASRYLLETNLPIYQISNIIGFAEPAVFTRACLRWFGILPTEIRRIKLVIG